MTFWVKVKEPFFNKNYYDSFLGNFRKKAWATFISTSGHTAGL